MATNFGKSRASVKSVSVPSNPLTKSKGAANVASANVRNLSSGKMGSGTGVTVGTTHGNHNVAHPC